MTDFLSYVALGAFIGLWLECKKGSTSSTVVDQLASRKRATIIASVMMASGLFEISHLLLYYHA